MSTHLSFIIIMILPRIMISLSKQTSDKNYINEQGLPGELSVIDNNGLINEYSSVIHHIHDFTMHYDASLQADFRQELQQ